VRRRRLSDGLLAAAAGALLAAAFPGTGWSLCAWFALVPLFRAIDGESVGKAFRLGWIAGVLFFGLSLDWIPATIARAGVTNRFALWIPWAATAAALALYPALFAAGLRYWQIRVGGDGLAIAVALWVGLEWCRSTLFLPCPWDLLGYSQAPLLPLLQLCDLTGIYGVSALVVGVNHGLYNTFAGRAPLVRLALLGAVWLLAMLYGDRRLTEKFRVEREQLARHVRRRERRHRGERIGRAPCPFRRIEQRSHPFYEPCSIDRIANEPGVVRDHQLAGAAAVARDDG